MLPCMHSILRERATCCFVYHHHYTGAAEEGRYDLLKQLHMECGCPWNVGAIAKAAAASGQDTLSVLQWLWEQVYH
jgi:hypothetical protein